MCTAPADRRWERAGRLADLASAAARDLSADAVVVTRRGGRAEPLVLATAGITRARATRLLPALLSIERWRGRGVVTHVLACQGTPLEAAEPIRIAGFGSVMTARVHVGTRGVGAIHLLRREPGIVANEALVRAYTSHFGVAIARATSRRQPSPPSRDVLDAINELPWSTRSFPELIKGLDAALAATFGSGTCGIMLWDRSRNALQMVPGSFGSDERMAASYRINVSNVRSNAARVFATGDAYFSNRAPGDPAILQDYTEAFGIERLLSVSLVVGRRPVGILHHANKHRNYTVSDVWRLEPLIPHIACAVESATRLFAIERTLRLERILSNAAVAIARARGLHEMLSVALREMCDVTEASLVALVPTFSPAIPWQADHVSAELKQRLLREAREQPDSRSHVTGPQYAGDPGSVTLHLPVKLGDKRVGTLTILRSRAEPFLPTERNALARIADLAAVAWAAEGYQQQVALQARLAERQRIADDLHDDVAQILFAAQTALDSTLELSGLPAEAVGNVTHARALLVTGDQALRGAIHHLEQRPKAELTPELEALVREVEYVFGLPVHLDISLKAADMCSRLGMPAREALLKVVREALVNAAKHAGPCRVNVRISLSRRLRLTVSIVDDGTGISAGQSHCGHGLTSLRRAVGDNGGRLRIGAGPLGGTTVCATFPV